MVVLGKTIPVEFAKGIADIDHIQGAQPPRIDFPMQYLTVFLVYYSRCHKKES